MLDPLAKRVAGTEPGFSAKHVRWAIELDSRNGFTGLVELGQPDQKRNPGRNFSKCPDLTQPELVSGGAPRSHFLVETASVVAMYRVDPSDMKTRQKHAFFVSMLEQAGKSIPQLATIARFMSDEDTLEKIRKQMERSNVSYTDKVTFQLDDKFPLEQDYWHDWWRAFRQQLAPRGKHPIRSPKLRCFATGELVTPARTHPKIKGLARVGGLISGDVLVGFDKEAFRSYGLSQSANAAVSEDAAKAYTSSLNDLIRTAGTTLAGSLVVHWFKQKVLPEDDPVPFLTEAADNQQLNAQERARRLLRSVETGEKPELVGNHYYILTMSGAAGRVMVRDWLEGEFEELVRNVNQWFDDLQIVREDGASIARPPQFVSLLQSLGRDLHQIPAPLLSKLWRAAVRGEEVPYQAIAQSVVRRRLETIRGESLSVSGMALLRAYHLRKYRKEANELAETLTPKLNKDFPNVAYQCGRLMAALAELQHAALGDVGAGVVQRYYAAASTTPALVLGRLTSNSQHHLSKLEAGLGRWYESIISEIWSKISEPLPRTLSLEEQSLFALGYYHQLASFRARKSQNENKEKEG